jgi:hypothetical protein
MKKLLIAVMAFSLGFAGCRKEANQVVSRPLNEVQGSVVEPVKHSPTPRPSPTGEEVVAGAAGENVAEFDDDWRPIGIVVAVVVFTAILAVIARAVYGMYQGVGADPAREAAIAAWLERQQELHQRFLDAEAARLARH